MSCNKVLFICQDYTQANEGQSVVTRRNLRLLKQMGFDVEQIIIGNPSFNTKLRNLILGEGYGYSKDVDLQVKASFHNNYSFVFFDRSIFGPLVREYAKRGKRILCFYHNVEAHLARSRFKVTNNPLYWFFSRYLTWNEAITAKYADIHISISERDQRELKESYGLSEVYLMSTSFQPVSPEYLQNKRREDVPYCLFVGSDFFANQQGINWFLKEVAPHIKMNLKIVGSICNSIEKQCLSSNVHLEGYVNDLNAIYADASCVISPIFSGSGLKTKTIEALRYGKVIFGTDEAFVGIKQELFNKM